MYKAIIHSSCTVIISSSMQVWCCVHRPNSLRVLDPSSHSVVFTYSELEHGVSVVLPVDNHQVMFCQGKCYGDLVCDIGLAWQTAVCLNLFIYH